MGLADVVGLDAEVVDPYDEVFELFSTYTGSSDLGMLDPRAKTVELCIARRDFILHQSPGVLASDREGGTTGAVVWKISIPFAEWITDTSNILFEQQVFTSSSTVLELGAGVGLVGLALSPHISRYILTDQEYMMKILHKNIEENTKPLASGTSNVKGRKKSPAPRVQTLALDWETSDVSDLARLIGNIDNADCNAVHGIDAVVASDCVFNEALIEPFAQTCASICALRSVGSGQKPTVCIIAQQLRSPDVFEAWLHCMLRRFRVWRLSEGHLANSSLAGAKEFVVHLATLRHEDGESR